MADICIVYASEDHSIAETLYTLLAAQYEVWWDDKIAGRFSQTIELELTKAGCIVALFSAQSRSKDTFTEELRLGQKHKVVILPVRLDDSDPPYPFGSYSYTELRCWKGDANHPGFRQLLRRIGMVIPPKPSPSAPYRLQTARCRYRHSFFRSRRMKRSLFLLRH